MGDNGEAAGAITASTQDSPVSGDTPCQPLFPTLKTCIIKRTSKLDGLFSGFKRFRGISFGASPEIVLELLERHGFESVELILGENLTQSSRERYAKERITLERLTELMEKGRVRILVPRDSTVIHTKLYFLDSGDGSVRVVSTSSNLTRTGVSGKQVNHAVWGDLPAGDALLKDLERDYAEHAALCEPFLGDLMDLVKKEGDRARAIDIWLATSSSDPAVEERRIVAGMLAQAFEKLESGQGPVTLELPPESDLAKHLKKTLIDPANGRKLDERTYQFDAPALIEQFQKGVSGMPLMRVHPESRKLSIWANGQLHERSAPPEGEAELNRSLDHLEQYVETVRFGATSHPEMAKSALWEALLAILSAPFAHEEMKAIRKRYSTEVVSRGPAIICIHGPSHNGKTTFLKFALKLICGFPVEPLPGQEFRQARIRAYTSTGNLFPLVFDDILAASASSLEPIVKSYWEQGGWQEEVPHPQLVMTTNREAFKSWAKTRIKRIPFDIEYDRASEGTRTLSDLFSRQNNVFRGFAHLYLDSLASGDADVLEDPVSRARRVVLRLYELAGREVPKEFPREAFETLFDQDKLRWRELLRMRRVSVRRFDANIHIEFAPVFQTYEISEYDQLLPQGIKSRRSGNVIKIENPAQFESWVGTEYVRKGILERLAGIFSRKRNGSCTGRLGRV